jgi:peptidyl-prolyl cis-trans isomerase D
MVLQSIRERLTGILAIFIFSILIIPFAFVGINSYFQTGAENLVARVNDKDITVSDFTQSYSNYRRRMQSIMGASFDPAQFESLIERRRHLDSLIDEEILSQAAQSIKLDIDDERLGEEIRRIPSFQLDGEFNLDVYLARLTSQGLSVKQFEREMRAQFVLGQLPSGVAASSFTTDTELADYVSLQDQKRSFRSILFPPVADASVEQPEDDAIQSYYDENQMYFQSEEMVEIEYLELNVIDIPTGTEPDEAFLRNRFEQQKGRFLSAEQRQVSHVLVEVSASADEATKETAKQRAQDVVDRARAGEDFADLAREFSDDIGSAEFGGDLGWLESGIMSESFEEAMYGLTLGSPFSEPVQTGFGWHVIQLRDIQPATGMSYEEARATLVQEHQEEEAEREFLEKADRLVDMIYEDPTTLDAAALELGLDVQLAGPFTRAGGEGIAANPEVVSAAYSELVLLQGSASDPIDLDTNHMVMLRVKEHFPVEVQPVEEVREQIVSRILNQRALDEAKQQAEAMLAGLQVEGADLSAMAEQGGYAIVETEAAARRDLVPDRTVVEEIFRLDAPAEGESLARVVRADNGYALVILESVTAGTLEAGAVINEQQYRRQIANAAASIEVTGMMRQLRDLATIEVYEERLK